MHNQRHVVLAAASPGCDLGMRTALILGGTGQIGRPAARRLAEDGWDVTLAARHEAEVGFPVRVVDRTAPGELEAAVGDGVDLLVDVVPYTLADARQVVGLRGRVGSVIAISSAAVYGDAEGLTFNSQEQGLFPRFPVPISENQPTAPPGDETYSQRKRAIELALLEHEDLRATIVRPGAIHGPHARFSREWYFVKRILDGRPAVVLARRGASRFHTTSAENLAELIRLAARRPRRRVLNCGDPSAPSAVEIARACATALAHELA
jgi:nucleoside-diphosphate-sugar epimerase